MIRSLLKIPIPLFFMALVPMHSFAANYKVGDCIFVTNGQKIDATIRWYTKIVASKENTYLVDRTMCVTNHSCSFKNADRSTVKTVDLDKLMNSSIAMKVDCSDIK